jgi:general secretion pathway protein D
MRLGLFSLFFLMSALSADERLFGPDVEGAREYNQSLSALRDQLREKFERAAELSRKGGGEGDYRSILGDVKALKQEIRSLEERWRKSSIEESSFSDEAYALWDVGETTLSQLVMEYGATDYLYVIPQELSGMKISLFSSVPLPRESWSDMIEMILVHNGIGIKKLNPFAKQLFILKLDPSAIEGIVSKEEDLDLFSSHARLFFVLSPPAEQLKSLQAFFERFSDPKQTTIQAIGSKVVLISTRETLEKLLGLYRAVWEKEKGKVIRLIHLAKIAPAEAEKVLKSFFADSSAKGRPNFYPSGADELATLTLPQGLVLIGENDTVDRGEKIISDLEAQLDDPGEKVIYWYSCKHSNPEDIAAVLEKVYDSLIGSSFEKRGDSPPPAQTPQPPSPPAPSPALSSEPSPAPMYPGQNTVFNPVLPANPPFIQPGTIDKSQKTAFGNFIVDTKTTSILMVVRREELPKIKALLKRMDVPKRMVQLDVLLVEKKMTDRKQVGFNLLQFGTNSSGKKENAITFDTNELAVNKGVLSYIFSRPSGKWPAMDIKYNFLLAQDDIRINANPSVLAINQTPATVSIVEEISINNGAFPIQTQSGVLIEQSFTRAQYGITIVLTPTIHLSQNGDEGDQSGFVTLQTNLEFDTTQISFDDRPPVTRRHIENEVCVADGETVILGGLRRKIEEDSREKIPFLGDIPGIGKLFGAAKSTDTNTEMFIFITPRIIRDPVEDLRRIRQSEYQKRAGDIPEFLERLDEAKNQERKRLFDDSLKMLFDMY